MVKLQGAVGADFILLSCFTPRLLFSLFLQLQLFVFLVWDLQLRCYLCMSQFIPGAQQSSPHFRELGKDMALPVNLKRAVCGRNCRNKSFPPPSSSHHRRGRWCLPAFSQALSPLYFHVVKEATGSLGFTCLWGKGRAALRGESFSLLALQTMGEGLRSSNFAALSRRQSWYFSFEMENVASDFCPVSWVLIQLLQGIQDFCG